MVNPGMFRSEELYLDSMVRAARGGRHTVNCSQSELEFRAHLKTDRELSQSNQKALASVITNDSR